MNNNLIIFLFFSYGRFSRKHFWLFNFAWFSGWLFVYSLGILSLLIPFQWLRFLFFLNFLFYPIYTARIVYNSVIKRLHDLGYDEKKYDDLKIPILSDLLVMDILFGKGQIFDNAYGPTTWTPEEIEKAKPDQLKRKVNEITIKKYRKKHRKKRGIRERDEEHSVKAEMKDF